VAAPWARYEVRGTSVGSLRGSSVVSLLLLLFIVLACADFEPNAAPPLPDSVVAEPSFARDIQPVLAARCATSGCHSVVTHQAGLVLASGHAYDSTVARPSHLVPGEVLVAPGDAENSLLVRVLGDDPARRFNLPRMPLGREPLTERQIANIVTWVTQGAVRN